MKGGLRLSLHFAECIQSVVMIVNSGGSEPGQRIDSLVEPKICIHLSMERTNSYTAPVWSPPDELFLPADWMHAAP